MGVLTPPEHNCDVAAKSFGDTKLTGLWLSGNEFRLQELGKGSREELKEFHVQRIRDQRGPQLSQRQVGQGSQFVSATATVGAIGPVLVQMLCVGKPDVLAFRALLLCHRARDLGCLQSFKSFKSFSDLSWYEGLSGRCGEAQDREECAGGAGGASKARPIQDLFHFSQKTQQLNDQQALQSFCHVAPAALVQRGVAVPVHWIRGEQQKAVATAEQVDLFESLTDQLTFSQSGQMEPPHWVSVARPPPTDDSDVIAATARMSQFVASWPNLSPYAYSQPDARELPVLERILETGSLPRFVPPRLLYRLNVWLVGPAPDSPELEHQARTLSPEDDMKAHSQESGDLLYRQCDLPPSAFPEKDGDATVTAIKWCLPALLPDKTFRCTVEARFETNTAVHWWTPLMKSEEFVVERVPPPAPPELAPVADLPTPQLQKLLARRAPGSTSYIVVRWPWRVQGRPVELLRDACHALEFCPSLARQSLRDPTSRPLDPKGENAVVGRATGPWKEPKAQQVCFANFERGEVWFELPPEATLEPNWVPLLVASGLWTSSDHASEPQTVHLRWRLRAGQSDVAVTSAALHCSAATGPVRTCMASPSASSLQLAVPQRASRLAGSLRWTAWEGAVKHQFCYRLLTHQKRRKRGGLQTLKSTVSEDSEASDFTEDGSPSTSLPQASHLQPVTGWIELPPMTDDVKRLAVASEASRASWTSGLSHLELIYGIAAFSYPCARAPRATHFSCSASTR
ncbi:unnamed protein product [Symbiodinium natans]|uniref:Uncharacterized protein n=1 Tax=Symbiodinium natans TaxID=878477 RepID=A0A812GD31_9DINO|nr:unnamed protein product [Symbiodinium natans]